MIFLSTSEIAKMIGLSRQMVTNYANEQKWIGKERKGRGGGLEYEVAKLPPEIQAA